MRLIGLALMALTLPTTLTAQEVGKVGVDWVGNDIIVEAIRDTDVGGVTCHLAYFERSVLDRLSQGNWFEDPSNSAIECTRTGPIDVSTIRRGKGGDDVFSASRSLVFKTLRVKRIYDEENQVLVYLAHANQLNEGSAKMAISTVPLDASDMTSGAGQ